MIDRLIGLLDRDGVENDRQFFETEEGIAGLGDELFVSLIVQLWSGCILVLTVIP